MLLQQTPPTVNQIQTSIVKPSPSQRSFSSSTDTSNQTPRKDDLPSASATPKKKGFNGIWKQFKQVFSNHKSDSTDTADSSDSEKRDSLKIPKRSPSLPQSPRRKSISSHIDEKILCRVCEKNVNESEIESHTKLCTIRHEFKVKISFYDSKLQKLALIIKNRRKMIKDEHYEHVEWPTIRKICDYFDEKARKYSTEVFLSTIEREKVNQRLEKMTEYLKELKRSVLFDQHVYLIGNKIMSAVCLYISLFKILDSR